MECQNCAFDPIVNAVAALTKDYTVTIGNKNVQMNAIEYVAHRHKKTNPKVAKAARMLMPTFAKLRSFVENELLPKCQEVCVTCAKSSDDDNLSRGGQDFIFIEAMPGYMSEVEGGAGVGETGDDEGEGGMPTEEALDRAFFDEDGNDPADSDMGATGGWLNQHAIKQSRSSSEDGGVTPLPLSVECEVKRILDAFRELTMLQKCILLQRWEEKSFVDIGSMTWVPKEMKRHNDKQLVGFWWRQIEEKFPWAKTLSPKRRRKGAANAVEAGDGDYKTHTPSETYSEQTLDFGMDL